MGWLVGWGEPISHSTNHPDNVQLRNFYFLYPSHENTEPDIWPHTWLFIYGWSTRHSSRRSS
jgi:hypothetical protein